MDRKYLSSLVRSARCPKAARLRPAFLCCTIVLAASALPTEASLAADTYVEPQFDVRVEHNDNFSLVPGGSPVSDVYGYIADAQALIGIAGPRGDTSIRPRLRLQEYPDQKDMQRLEAFLSLRSQYEWQRSNFLLIGRYSRQDIYNADTPSGDTEGNPDSGQAVIGGTRTLINLQPTFDHKITERASIGVSADYENARYDTNGTQTKNDYDYGQLNGFVTWATSPTSNVTAGAYASRFETKDNSEQTDAVGGELGYDHRWSETSGIEATVFLEKNDTSVFVPVTLKDRTTDFGGSLTAYRKHEISAWHLTVGRLFIPTGDSGKSQSDQIRLQYDRELSQRLSLTGLARYDSHTALGASGGGNDRDYARADLSLKWFATRTWYLGGGYSYIWQKRGQAAGDESNNKLFVNFGYQALSHENR